jgi:hypothetical protein
MYSTRAATVRVFQVQSIIVILAPKYTDSPRPFVIRDSLDKEDKKKEKKEDQAERARSTALRTNDMDAYTWL